MIFLRGRRPLGLLVALVSAGCLLLAGCEAEHDAYGRSVVGEAGDAGAAGPDAMPAGEGAEEGAGAAGGIDLSDVHAAAGSRAGAEAGAADRPAGPGGTGAAGGGAEGNVAGGTSAGPPGSDAASGMGASGGEGPESVSADAGQATANGAAAAAPLPEEALWGTVPYRPEDADRSDALPHGSAPLASEDSAPPASQDSAAALPALPGGTSVMGGAPPQPRGPDSVANGEPDGNGGSGGSGENGGGAARVSPDGPTEAAGTVAGDSDASAEPRFPRPENVRGLYVNAWAAGSRARMSELIDIAGRTEVNALVIDIKDATGYVSHHTQVPLAHEIGATGEVRIRDIEGLLDKLDSAGVYPIARIVIVKDPILAQYRPELAVQDTAGGVWIDEKDTKWLNPYDTAVWDYHVDLAREVAELGFPEIQWDYVRFPDAPASQLDRAVFDGANGRSKAQAVREFLAYSRDRLGDLGVEVTADVFGVTTSAARDVGIGQVWESFIDVVDVALPMVYPSHYWPGSFGHDVPNAYPYEIVRHALTDALRRSDQVDGAGRTRPWLQDFTLGEPRYTAPEVRAQIQATYDAGIEEWVLWNPGSRYTVSALEPEEGFRYEPWMRVGGTIVPVSRRFEAIDAWREAEAAREAAERAAAREKAQAAARAARDSAAARAARDSAAAARDTTVGKARRDSLRQVERADTVLIGGR